MAIWLQVKNSRQSFYFTQKLRRQGAIKICIFLLLQVNKSYAIVLFFRYIIISGKFTTCTSKQSTINYLSINQLINFNYPDFRAQLRYITNACQ